MNLYNSINQLIMKESLKNIWQKINKPYFYIILFFLFINIFLTDNNPFYQYNLYTKQKTLEKELAYYQELIEANNRKLNELRTSPENLEKFAREEYFMKKKNEKVFIIVDKKDQ